MQGTDTGRLACIPLLCAALLTASCGRATPHASEARAEASDPRTIVLVALDAADWLEIDPMIRAGRLPAFERLRRLGRTGVMAPTPPLISPMLWTTIATGVEAENHGVLDFMADLPDGRHVPVGSSQRLAPALWNLFSAAGRRVGVVGWWATWPAEPVNGTIVSDALAPQLTRLSAGHMTAVVSPASAAAASLERVVDVTTLTRADLAAYVPLGEAEFEEARAALAQPGGTFYRNPLAHLAAVIAGTRTYGGITEALLTSDRPQLLAVYIEAIDTVSHLFVRDQRRGPAAIERAYVDADALLQRLARASRPDTLFVVVSDHGFYPSTAGIAEDPSILSGPATAWHRPYGIVAAATAESISTAMPSAALPDPADVGIVSPLDIAPTILHSAGLRIPSDMPGRVVTTMLPAEVASVPPQRTAPMPYRPPPVPAEGAPDDAAVERLQALGYVGAARTSLARQNLGENLFRRGQFAEAERQLRAVTAAQPSNLAATLWLAQALAAQGKIQEALAIYERAVALPEGARDALVRAVDLALGNGDLATAARLMSAHAPPAVMLVARGAVADARNDTAAAERAYRAAAAADPLSFDAAARLLALLAATGRVASAGKILERAVALAPDSPRHLALLGEYRLRIHDGTGAEAALTRALGLAPDAASVRTALARALLVQNKPAQATAVLLPAPPSSERDVLLGSAYSAQKDWTRAATHLRAALASGAPDDEALLNGLGWAELQLGHREQAADLFARSLKLNGRQPEIRKLLDEVHSGPRGHGR